MLNGQVLHRWRRFAAVAVVVYSVFLATAEFEHHDIACHFKTPFHCSSCASSPLSVNANSPAIPDASRLADAGRAIAMQVLSEDTLFALDSSGRSPPSVGFGL
jgi:hypothetical protein